VISCWKYRKNRSFKGISDLEIVWFSADIRRMCWTSGSAMVNEGMEEDDDELSEFGVWSREFEYITRM